MARINAKTYKIVTGTAFASLCTIVVTGALVRLTGSGLGCADWPRCSETKFIDVSSGHTFIEQANRLFTGVVSISVIAAVLLSHLATPKRKDLIMLSWSLVCGVIAQIVIGGVVVLTGLNPYANMAHFLVSMVLVTTSFTLMRRASAPADAPVFRHVVPRLMNKLYMLAFFAITTIITGTVVTATGPHAGNENAVRFGFELRSVARVHSISMVATLSLIVMIAVISRKMNTDSSFNDAVNALIGATTLQAVVGYTQYFTEVPAALVAVHIAGALFFYTAVLNTVLEPTT